MGTRRDAQQSSTNTAHKLEDMLITDSVMLDFMVDMPTMLPPSPSPSPPLSPRPSRLATLSPRSSAHLPSTPSPRSPARPELPKSSSTPLSPDTLTMELSWDKNFKPKSRTAI